MGTSDTIKEKYPNKELSCLNEALKLWILRKYKTERYGLPTWKMLLKAIGKVDENLFKKLAREHQGTIDSILSITYNVQHVRPNV